MKWRSVFSAALVAASVLAVAQNTAPPSTPAPGATPSTPGAAAPNPFTPELKGRVMTEIDRIVTQVAFVPGVDFSKWSEFVGKRKDDIDAANNPFLFANQINRALRDFGFSHIRLQAPTGGAPAGQIIGIGIQGEVIPDGIRIISVRPGGPAERAGLKQDEVITKIDGQPARNTEQIRGQLGQERTFEIRGTDGKLREVKLTLARIQVVLEWLQQSAPPASAPTQTPAAPVGPGRRDEITWPVPKETAMIRLVSFSGNFNRSQIAGFFAEAKDAKNLILDLRSNGGGSAENMRFLLSGMMPPNTEYGVFVNRAMSNRYRQENPNSPVSAEAIARWAPVNQRLRTREYRQLTVPPFKGRIAVLINGGSGSASEITAASLREQRGAVLIGTRTAGAVLASVFAPLSGGFRMQYPVSDYVTAKGIRLEGNPVQPDVEIRGRNAETDLHVQAALEAFAKPAR